MRVDLGKRGRSFLEVSSNPEILRLCKYSDRVTLTRAKLSAQTTQWAFFERCLPLCGSPQLS